MEACRRGLRAFRAAVLVVVAVPVACTASSQDEAAFLEGVKRDAAWIAGVESREVGAEGHTEVHRRLRERIDRIDGVRVWTQEFKVLMPVTERAELAVPSGPMKGTHRIYPLWPGLVRFNTTPPGGYSGRLIYVERGNPESIPARSVRGQLAAMELTGGGLWKRVFGFGARAVLLLGSEAESWWHVHGHMLDMPVFYPRFYVPQGALAEAIREGTVADCTVTCRASWQWRTARNVFALVKPDGPPTRKPALVVMAPLDAVSMFQGLAPGADAAVDAALVLNLLEEAAQSRPRRPVLFCFLDAQGINQLGVRRLLEALSVLPEDRRKIRREDEKLARAYDRHKALLDELGTDPAAALGRLYRPRYRPLHRYVKDILSPDLNYLDRIVPELRVAEHWARAGDEEALGERLRILAALTADLDLPVGRQADEAAAILGRQREKLARKQNRLKSLRNQMILRTPIEEANRQQAGEIWQTVGQRVSEQLRSVQEPLRRFDRYNGLREDVARELGLDPAADKPLRFLLGIDLSDSGIVCGPAIRCEYQRIDEYGTRAASDFVRWLSSLERDGASRIWPERLQNYVNLVPFAPQESPRTYIINYIPTLTSPATAFGQKAATWTTLEAPRSKVDTGLDRYEGLDWARLEPQVEVTRRLVRTLTNADDFEILPSASYRTWRRVWGTIVDRSPGDPVPRVPMPGFVTAAQDTRLRAVVGIRDSEFTITGIDGRFRFDGVTGRLTGGPGRHVEVQSFQLGADGQVVRAVSTVRKSSGLTQSANLQSDPRELRAMVFDCVEIVTPPYVWDVRGLRSLNRGKLFDARRGRVPTFYSLKMRGGIMAAFVPPETRWQFLPRTGQTSPRMLFINATEPAEERAEDVREDTKGFDPLQPLPSIPEYISALDYWRINERRLRGFRRAGIKSRAIESIHTRAQILLDKADRAFRDDDGGEMYRLSCAALADELRVYTGVRRTADDVVRAVIFLLLGLLPFSIAMERLLFASSHIYRQVLGTAGIFVVMCVALWSFHPAFRITSQPLMLVLAFLIIFLSTMVISILLRRFQSDLEKIRSGRAEESGASTARGGLIACALTIGIATMRKRKLRTALTGTTIALITFALLSFSSATSVQEYNRYELNREATHKGVLLQHPMKEPISSATLTLMHGAAGTNSMVVPSYWVNRARSDPNWRLHVHVPGTDREIMLKGGMALHANEPRVSRITDFIPEWDLFSTNRGCYLPAPAAAVLGVKKGDPLIVGGSPFVFVGTFDPKALKENLVSFAGDSPLPLDHASIDSDERSARRSMKMEEIARELTDADEGTRIEQLMPVLDPNEVVIVPYTSGVWGAHMHCVVVQNESAEEVRRIAEDMARRIDFPIYYSTGDRIQILTASPLKPSAPRSLLIPLLVAGLIVFNTMLNSIAERRKEIHVYTSLGLAPSHVAGIFLAEALTYGLLGGIFGYVVGQGLGDIVLNYAGTQVVFTMGLVLLVVMLSALVPATVAARVASPSKETGWHLAKPRDGAIHDLLPFTVTRRAAGGILAFLYEYLDAHREGAIGHFASDRMDLLPPDAGGQHLGGIDATVWLTPYDLGVRQDIAIRVVPTELDVCEIRLELRRQSGQEKSWYKLNRTFVADLRKQMLGWRNITPRRVLAYIAEARKAGIDLGAVAACR